jgi:hypothetical protein
MSGSFSPVAWALPLAAAYLRRLKKMTNGIVRGFSRAEKNRERQRRMEANGVTWDLEIVLSTLDGDEIGLSTLANFKKRGHLKPEVLRRVIAAARAALIDPVPIKTPKVSRIARKHS